MSVYLRAAGKWGSIFAILALIITLLKQIIGFIGFLTFAIKVLIVMAFAAMFIGVGLMALRTFQQRKKKEE